VEIVILGGTGFIGYDFVKLLLEQKNMDPVIYSSNPANLSNLARHKVRIQLFHASQISSHTISRTANWLVNFTHPFQNRDGLSPNQQIELYLKFIKKQLDGNTQLKLIHISSMSVYEPFGNGLFFGEESKIKPPKSDEYALNKSIFERSLLEIPGIKDRLLVLRPTVVYGPFCRPWTDSILSKLLAGDLAFYDLSGKIQPIYVGDISQFLLECIKDFQPGIFNLGGTEVVEWSDFFNFFKEIVRKGNLIRVEKEFNNNREKSPASRIKNLLSIVNQAPSVAYFLKPILRIIPTGIRTGIRNFLNPSDYKNIQYQNPVRELDTSFCKEFFAEDRLVSMKNFNRVFPEFNFTKLANIQNIMHEYFNYRFTDKLYV